jgi:non-canonical purine NTP pyrophosphatase (RdgB/HAM1 family)
MNSQNSNSTKQKIIIVTGNAGKAQEFAKLLGSHFEITNQKFDLEEIQGNPRDIARRKAKLASSHFGVPVVIEDTSLFLKEYGINTGAYCKWFGVDDNGIETAERQCRNFNKMSMGCEDKTLIALCIIAYCEPGTEPVLFEGSFEGICIPFENGIPKGEGAKYFGWDPVMGISADGPSFAQMTTEEKNEVSHRGRAVQAFIKGMHSKKRPFEDLNQESQPRKVIKLFTIGSSDGSRFLSEYLRSNFDVQTIDQHSLQNNSECNLNSSESYLPCDSLMQKAKSLAEHLKHNVIVQGSFVFPNWCGEGFASSVRSLGIVSDKNGKPVLDNGKTLFSKNMMCARLFAIAQGVVDDKRLTTIYALAYCSPGKEPVLFRDQIVGTICSNEQGKSTWNENDHNMTNEWESVFWLNGHSLAQLSSQERMNLPYRKNVHDKFYEFLKSTFQ